MGDESTPLQASAQSDALRAGKEAALAEVSVDQTLVGEDIE